MKVDLQVECDGWVWFMRSVVNREGPFQCIFHAASCKSILSGSIQPQCTPVHGEFLSIWDEKTWGRIEFHVEHWHPETWALMWILWRVCWESHLPLLGLVKWNQWPTPFLQYLLWISEVGVRNLGFQTIIVTKMLYAFEINILNLFFLISSFWNLKLYYCQGPLQHKGSAILVL